jgi:hypothetical protein
LRETGQDPFLYLNLSYTEIERNSLKKNPQNKSSGEVHNWYKIALGFSDQLVDFVLKKFSLKAGAKVLDPFCGSGTTLVECKKRGINSIGIDANPSSCFAATVKTNWTPNPRRIMEFSKLVQKEYSSMARNGAGYKTDQTYTYLHESGMVDRGWINENSLVRCIYLKRAIQELNAPRSSKELLFLALIDVVLREASNVKFGPQLYVAAEKENVKILRGFLTRVGGMSDDLKTVKKLPAGETTIYYGDARECNSIVDSRLGKQIFGVICSPPYPGEHDYTRHARLELAFLEEVIDKETLRKVKRQMIRSNTKGIYKEDKDRDLVEDNQRISKIVQKIDVKAKKKEHGFARLYSTVVQEYFGGMKRHLQNLHLVLPSGAKCAYVVGDQSSYLQVHIPTAKILAEIAVEVGYEYMETKRWRTSWSSKTSKKVNENILVLRKP